MVEAVLLDLPPVSFNWNISCSKAFLKFSKQTGVDAKELTIHG